MTPPAGWINTKVNDNSTFPNSSAVPDVLNDYMLYVAPSAAHNIMMFDDTNSDGWISFNEPRISYPANPVDTTPGDQVGIDIAFTTIDGTIIPPGGWGDPRVAGFPTPWPQWGAAPGAGVYTLETGYDSHTVIMYDDVNGNQRYDTGEAALQWCPGGVPTPVDTTPGPQVGIDLTIATTCVYP